MYFALFRTVAYTPPTMKIWKQQLQSAITEPAALYALLDLAYETESLSTFPLRVPLPFVSRMKKGDPNDPLLLQVMTQSQELVEADGYSDDPLAEKDANPIPGLLHKYYGRVLLTLTGSCAVNCRYCFRRHFPYTDNQALANWQQILDYIASDKTIKEVIFSGGEPLLVDDEQLQDLILSLEKISHLETLRFHTRMPVVIPARITDAFVNLLQQTRLQIVTVLHINHPNEIDLELADAVTKLKSVSQLLNQSVLLKGVNDSADVLVELSQKLFNAGILPYYLHQLDHVNGAQHFYISQEQGLKIIAQMQALLPGYLVPRYVIEQPLAANKLMVS